jgi:hypothetical protein
MKMKFRIILTFFLVTAALVSIILLIFMDEIRSWIGSKNTTSATTNSHENFTRSEDIPVLPFNDNPDPDQCGIPIDWGDDNQAWLTGYYQGELIEPVVHLYDSHLRLEVTAQAPHGTEVEVILFQENPVLDYYLVKLTSQTGPGSEGWVPAPLLSFDPPNQ